MYKEKYMLEESIQDLHIEINKIKNNEYINDYFLKIGHLLYDYYDGTNILGKEFQSKGEDNISEENEKLQSEQCQNYSF